MKVLLLGSGGREHAIGWKISQSPLLTTLISAPGNPGLAGFGETALLDITDPSAVIAFAIDRGVDLVVVGPEAPLAAGVADAFAGAPIRVFGPLREAARLETSKDFAKRIMQRAGVPTAGSETFSERRPALDYLATAGGPYVVKADGLAGGKGVVVTPDLQEARAWVEDCFAGRFGTAGRTVVIEEHLEGDEISVFGLSDGRDVIGLEPARDYKRLMDGDLGPNTGGMGSFSPVAGHDGGWVRQVVDQMIKPVLACLTEDGTPYVGFIYAGLMLTDAGPKVLEFNCRLGDPEAQAILPRLDSDLLGLIVACLEGGAPTTAAVWSDLAAVNVVLAAKGYPEAPVSGDRIFGVEAGRQDSLVFHAGTTVDDGRILTNGGRVLSVVGLGPDIEAARVAAYDRAAGIEFAGRNYRTDIGR